MKNIFNHFVIICNALGKVLAAGIQMPESCSIISTVNDLSDPASFLLTSPSSATCSRSKSFQQAL